MCSIYSWLRFLRTLWKFLRSIAQLNPWYVSSFLMNDTFTKSGFVIRDVGRGEGVRDSPYLLTVKVHYHSEWNFSLMFYIFCSIFFSFASNFARFEWALRYVQSITSFRFLSNDLKLELGCQFLLYYNHILDSSCVLKIWWNLMVRGQSLFWIWGP